VVRNHWTGTDATSKQRLQFCGIVIGDRPTGRSSSAALTWRVLTPRAARVRELKGRRSQASRRIIEGRAGRTLSRPCLHSPLASCASWTGISSAKFSATHFSDLSSLPLYFSWPQLVRLNGALCPSQRFRRAGSEAFSLHIPRRICILPCDGYADRCAVGARANVR